MVLFRKWVRGGKPVTKEIKGSQLHIRNYVNDYSEVLNQEIFSHSPSLLAFTDQEQQIEWKSPLAHEKYKEYQDDFLKFYYDEDDKLSASNEILRTYWPKNGPVWDGLGIVEGTAGQKGLILVEAKAHRHETHSKIKATSPQSLSKITETLTVTKNIFSSTEPIVPIDPWLNDYYQLANRLAYLHILNQELQIPAWLILVQFIDDDDHIATSKEEWIAHYQKVFQTLGIYHAAPLLSRLVVLYLPVIPNKNLNQ